MKDCNILVIDDNQMVLKSLKLVLKKHFNSVTTMPDPKSIMGLMQNNSYDVILLDMNFDSRKLDGEEGLFWLGRINALPNPPAVVLITAFGDIDLAVRAVQQGAEDFVTKPWSNDVLIEKLGAAIEKHKERMLTANLLAKANELREQIEADKNLTLEDHEKKHIMEIIAEEKGNLVSAAARLDVSRQTLYNKLKRYGAIN